MTWSATKTWAVGETFTSADANAYIRDDLQFTRDAFREDIVTKDAVVWNNAASAAYADYGGAGFVQITNWVKRQADTDVRVRYRGGGWAAVIAGVVQFGAKIGATDYNGGLMNYNLTGARENWSGIVNVTGLASGTYNVTLRIKSNTATLQYNTDTLEGVAMEVFEATA